ncbi:NmrA family NAD(P)-binding protein [Nocardia sp. NPDC052566]|uniref:NmrA family NAD(P)-binding protein n=1 Tax=Nocardia sp. NPDC052566 TaxID=3364330 RepID=UPI0037CBA31D
MEPILVTGAAGGQQGSTGRRVVELLLGRGLSVRAMVHADDARADALRGLGAEVVAGDLREIADTRPALQGVRSAYFTYPVVDGFIEATGAFAAAAKEAGVERVVAVSQLASGPQALTPRMRQHWVAEQILDWAGIGAVHLRAAVFFENIALLARTGDPAELAMPMGPPETVLPLIAGQDVARVAAGILADPARPVDPVVLLTGEVMSIAAVADTLGVTYRDVPPDAWHRWALDFYGSAHPAEHLSKLWEIFRLLGEGTGLYHVTDTIHRHGGHPPTTLAEFAAAPG